MNTRAITVEVPSDILLALNSSEEELKQSIKSALAIRLYRQEKLSIGKAAELSGLSKSRFEEMLSENEIPVSNLSLDDVIEDIRKLSGQ